MPLFHTYSKVCVIRTLITTKTLFYWTNAGDNAFLHVIPRRKSLEFSLCDNLAPMQKSGNVQFKTKQKLTFKFLTLFTAKDVDFMHFKVFRTEIYIEMSIEWTIMGKPVLISKLQDRSFGITMYWCRALHTCIPQVFLYDR